MARIKAYFRLDLFFFENPKVVDLSHAAGWLYISAIAYCNRRETDGFVAAPMLRRLVDVDPYQTEGPSYDDLAHELVKVGLWHLAGEPCPEGHDEVCPPMPGDGWRIHDFLEHNESSTERDSRRADDAARKRRERDKAKERPDGPEPPSNPPSGNVRSDTTGRPDGRNTPSGPIEVTEQSTSRAEQKVNTVVPLGERAGPDSEQVRAVFDAWTATLPAGSRPRLTDARRDAIKAALRRYPADDVLDAARGWRNDPWPERAQHNDLALLLHMGSRRKPANILERMRNYARNGRPVVLSRPSAQLITEHQRMDRWVEQMEGGGTGDHDAAGVAGDPRPAPGELPRPGAAG